jgi:hypothetical protein
MEADYVTSSFRVCSWFSGHLLPAVLAEQSNVRNIARNRACRLPIATSRSVDTFPNRQQLC